MDIYKWIFHNCPKDHAWILYQNIDIILANSNINPNIPKITSNEQILYIHSIIMTSHELHAIIQTINGFYYIENIKHTSNNNLTTTITNNNLTTNITNNNDSTNRTNNESINITNNESTNITNNDSKDLAIDGSTNITNNESKDGLNIDKIESKIIYYATMETLVNNLSNGQRKKLCLMKIKNMKKVNNVSLNVYPYEFINKNGEQINTLLSKSLMRDVIKISKDVSKNVLHLNLAFNFTITDEHLSNFDSNDIISILSFHTNFRLKSFKFVDSKWTNNIERLNINNMPHFKNNALGFLTHKLNNLKELYVSACPQVNIRSLLDLLSINKLEILCFYDVQMVCQPNRYVGLIDDHEWNKIKNHSLQELMIKSENLSLDVIDYIKDHCYVLKRMVISPYTLKYMCQNINNIGDINTFPLFFNDGNTDKELKLGRDFKLNNLIKYDYQKPFSDSMLNIINKINQDDNEQ